MENKQIVLSLSGGMDSSTLLLYYLDKGYECTCISFDYGQKHKIELERAKELVKYLNQDKIRLGMSEGAVGLVEKLANVKYIAKYPKIIHQIIKLDGLSNLLVSGLVDNNSMELKKGHYAHENALTSVVPNRNAIMASIVYAVALSKVKQTGEQCLIALGTHLGDFDNNKKTGIYPDCSEEFRDALEHAFKIGNWDSDKVNYEAPYNVTDKTGVLKSGIESCKRLKLNYKEVYKRTNTSYAPIKVLKQKIETKNDTGFAVCYDDWLSDYKSGSSIERIEAFINLGLEDPLQYAEEDGNLVSWDFIENYVKKVIEDYKLNVK